MPLPGVVHGLHFTLHHAPLGKNIYFQRALTSRVWGDTNAFCNKKKI